MANGNSQQSTANPTVEMYFFLCLYIVFHAGRSRHLNSRGLFARRSLPGEAFKKNSFVARNWEATLTEHVLEFSYRQTVVLGTHAFPFSIDLTRFHATRARFGTKHKRVIVNRQCDYGWLMWVMRSFGTRIHPSSTMKK
jgi:hypothetical protein